jgi:hypothetical protein
VECNVVLGHELVKLDLFVVFPPFLPILMIVVSSDREIAYGCIKPHIKDFVFIAFFRNLSAPFEVSGDASAFETLF